MGRQPTGGGGGAARGESGWDAADGVDDLAGDEGPEHADEGLIRLGAKPDATTLRDALMALEHLGTARVDASEVERLPGPAFQILLIAMRDALFAGGKMRVVNPSFAFGLCFEAFGLGGDLEPFQAEYL